VNTYGERIQAAVAAEIRAERAAQGLSQLELAERAGMKQNTLSRYTATDDAKRRDLPYTAFAEIAKALGLTPRELAERAERRLEGQD
jgi:transcriptional regulator with XRE-family HTH domain